MSTVLQKAAARSCLYCGTLTFLEGPFCCSACRLLSDEGWSHSATKQIHKDFIAYDEDSLRTLYDFSDQPDYSIYRIYIDGLQCASCVHLIENLPQYIEEVLTARLDFSRSELFLKTKKPHSLAQILSLLQYMGYTPIPVRPGSTTQQYTTERERADLRRIGVAAACAGNIMLFTIPIYAGLTGHWVFIFNSISFILFLPIAFYSAIPIYKSAYNSLIMGKLNVDLPLAIAFITGFIASTYNWLRGNTGIYFDSSASFIFLIMSSRWFLHKMQRRWANNNLTEMMWNRKFYTIVRNGQTYHRQAEEIQAEDKLSLLNQDCVPADGKLLSSSAAFDTSWMTGEAVPRYFSMGMDIRAGYRLVSESAQIAVTTTSKESELAQTLARVEAEAMSESRRINIFDRTSRWLIATVLGLGLGIVVLSPYTGITFNVAFARALSLLIVACPCALAFGGPLAYAMSLRLASRRGILAKSADALDSILDCKTIVFDKTGTLTTGHLEFKSQTPSVIPIWVQNLILNLEHHSQHPVAQAFRNYWKGIPYHELELRDVYEFVGKSIFGLYEGRLYSLQASEAQSQGLTVSLRQDDHELVRFEFDDQLRAESVSILQSLAKKFQLAILSGDRNDRVKRLVEQLNISGITYKGEATPDAKAQFIQQHNPCLMVGDGVNDMLALSKAHVGVAMNGAVSQSLKSTAIYFLKPGLQPLMDLFEIARTTRRVVRSNLLFALAYNLIAGVAALLGYVNPLVAAVLMPISSFIILLNTWRVLRCQPQ